jgi:hypothetical protein
MKWQQGSDTLDVCQYPTGPYQGIRYYGPEEDLPPSPVREENGRWYILMWIPGFNSPANNRLGYASEAQALAAIRRYQSR